jgi:uncharacterized protein
MLALTFMSIGASVPFLRSKDFDQKRSLWLVVITLIGSAYVAILLVMTSQGSIPIMVSAAMIGVAIFSLIYRQAGADEATISPTQQFLYATAC